MVAPSLLYRKIIYCSSDSLDPVGVLNNIWLCVERDMLEVSGSGGDVREVGRKEAVLGWDMYVGVEAVCVCGGTCEWKGANGGDI